MSTAKLKPMLGYNKSFNLEDLVYPVYASTKLDGIRCLIKDGVALSRKLLPIPNLFVQAWAKEHADALEGHDGELIVGPPNAPDVRRATMSGVTSINGEPDFIFYLFDHWNRVGGFEEGFLRNRFSHVQSRVVPLGQYLCNSPEQVRQFEAEVVSGGYEGVILRYPNSLYKFGRSTLKEGALLKLKQFLDFEVTITGINEAMHNANEATVDELGHTKRSHAAAGRTEGKGYVGSMDAVDEKGRQFKIGTFKGLSVVDKGEIWDNRQQYVGRRATIKAMEYGAKDAPLHGVFLGWRHEID